MNEKRRVANMPNTQPFSRQTKITTLLGDDGKQHIIMHDGSFAPSPKEPTIVFVPSSLCDETPSMRSTAENPQQITNGSYKYLRTAFLTKINQYEPEMTLTIDYKKQEAKSMSRMIVNNITIAEFSEDMQEFLTPYLNTSQIVVADTKIDHWLADGTHKLSVKYNDEISETIVFDVCGDVE